MIRCFDQLFKELMNKVNTNNQTVTDTADDIDAAAFAKAIDLAKIAFTPAFVHGLLSAYCCEEENAHGWATLLVSDIDPSNETLTTQLRYLNRARNIIGTQLSDSELSFSLLLDNRAETLHDEVLLTREWASGYLLGVESLALNERVGDDDFSSEFLSDLAQIAAMPLPDDDALAAASVSDGYTDHYDSSDEFYDQDGGDDTRSDILEIQEYCRAGAIGVFLTCWQSQ